MSDPVTNVEIEDVLSSIRRLVSEGEKARQPSDVDARLPHMPQATGAAAGLAKVDKGKAAAPEKLVLTPALRVAGPDDLPQKPAVEVPASDEPEQDKSDRASLEATIAELEAAVVRQDQEWEPDGSEVKAPQIGWRDAADTADPQDAVAEAVDSAAQDQADDAVALPLNLDQPLADFARHDDPAPAEVDTVEDLDDTSADDDASKAVAEALLSIVPEMSGQEEPSDPSVAFRHLANHERDSIEELTGRSVSDDDETLDAFLARGGGVDEAALRTIVMDIVREELQGPMGERITRNVRKLVRREIMRVLNAQDMD